MRKFYNELKNKCGKKRIIHKFLWIPKRIEDEMRWLEFATFEQEVYSFDNWETGELVYKWINLRWIDD